MFRQLAKLVFDDDYRERQFELGDIIIILSNATRELDANIYIGVRVGYNSTTIILYTTDDNDISGNFMAGFMCGLKYKFPYLFEIEGV